MWSCLKNRTEAGAAPQKSREELSLEQHVSTRAFVPHSGTSTAVSSPALLLGVLLAPFFFFRFTASIGDGEEDSTDIPMPKCTVVGTDAIVRA